MCTAQQCSQQCSQQPLASQAHIATLQAEVGRHEPHLALDGGAGSGTTVLTPVYKMALEYLEPDGLLVLETNGGAQAEGLQAAMAAVQCKVTTEEGTFTARYASVEVIPDLFCVPRFVLARAGRS